MGQSRKAFHLEEGKIQASILLKNLRSSDLNIAKGAAKRFQCLAEFSDLSQAQIIEKPIKRKHALNVIAIEHGFPSWTDLKTQIRLIIGGHLNHWFSTYESAKTFQASHGGFLFPYKSQFFICDAAYLREIGFDPEDKSWEEIGYDWVQPKNLQSWQDLYRQWSS